MRSITPYLVILIRRAAARDVHSSSLGLQDDIVFNYPHLGDGGLADEAAHAQRHSILVAHYLHEAAALLAPGGRVHLTLSGKQPTTWAVEASAARHGLALAQAMPPTTPAAFVLAGPPAGEGGAALPLVPPRPEWAARRDGKVAGSAA